MAAAPEQVKLAPWLGFLLPRFILGAFWEPASEPMNPALQGSII
eukprot:COSAG01_NODE_598_length_15018_cov_60.164488_11_plen_44_part_00